MIYQSTRFQNSYQCKCLIFGGIPQTHLTFSRGGVYYGHGHGENPFDTINLMGTFKLLCDDYIVIRPIGDPKLVYTNTEASYFGVVQINPARSLLHGDHSCNPQE